MHIPHRFFTVNKVDGALVEATAFLVCRQETSTGSLTVNKVDGKQGDYDYKRFYAIYVR